MRGSPSFRFLAVLVAALAACLAAHAHDELAYLPPPAAAPPDAAALEHSYRLFTEICRRCPTERQAETLEVAERIYQAVWPPVPGPADAARRTDAAAEADRHYRLLCRDYPRVRVAWTGTGIRTLQDLAPIALARGLERGVLLEVENQSGRPVSLAAECERREGEVTAPVRFQAGETRAFLVPLLADSTALRRLRLGLHGVGPGGARGWMDVPVDVVEPARVRGRLLDRQTGQPWPGRVRLRGADGQLRYGLAFLENATLSEKPVVFRPAWYRLPFFYSDGAFEALVPPGRTRVTLERGFEHRPVTRELDLQPGETLTLTLASGRFLDMRRRGWVSADTHVHWVKNSWDVNEELGLLRMVQRAEDVRVINNLTLYQYRPEADGGAFLKPDHHPMGPVPGLCGPDYHVQMGEEYRNDQQYGHLNLLGISELIRPLATGEGSGGPAGTPDYPLNRDAIREARRQGGISIEAHNLGPFHTSDVPVNVALGLADSLDQLEPEHYYRFLNSGFHIGLTNGSDHPARVVGCARAYVRVPGPFSYAAWLDGVRRGRTFTTSGPLLFLAVNGRGPGETLDLSPGQRVHVRARAVSRFPLGTVEIVANGEVVKSVRTDAREAVLSLDLPADRSRWFCLRASRSGRSYDALSGPDIGHTSAVYTRVEGREVLRREALEFWIDNVRRHAERVRVLGVFRAPAHREEALAHIAEGLRVYEARLRELARER